MQCPKCQFENRQEAKFCSECGFKFELSCPKCGNSIRAGSKFCDECGCTLKLPLEIIDNNLEIKSPSPQFVDKKELVSIPSINGERKHITVLFSDLTGYTAMSERMDPEEVKEITTRIFDDVSKVVKKYDGFIEKFAGDAVMALFGAKEAHEDDPVRAIKAAREIHSIVNALSPKYEDKIEQVLSMHTGINTGLVVTGDINLEKGTHGVTGDAINVASRLSALGNADDILVGQNTYNQAEGFFDFDELEPKEIKGKKELIKVYKVLSPKEIPIKIHRLHGLRSDLIGRKVEMNQLSSALQRLSKDKKGSIVTICGPAGTGKSRLVEEFRSSLKLENIQWLEGHAYPYSQNISYYPLIDLLNKALQIDEGDSPDIVKQKIQIGISGLIGFDDSLIPYIGSLFSIRYPDIENVSPEFWKNQLQKAVLSALDSLSENAPMVVCLEDLHWSDPSFLEMIRTILSEFRTPIFFICTHRPIISLFTSHQIESMTVPYREIRLQDLSPSESQEMVESLLMTDSIPDELRQFLQDKIEGNPFYIEEIINSFIESEMLIRDSGGWKVKRKINEADISSNIHGVISGRLDRLEKDTKRILQEASVVGRSFLYDILKRITDLKNNVDKCLSGLERLDLIKTRAVQPDLEYIFKHALTQEIVYNGLLKKERKGIHERVGTVIEQLFHDRLPEFYETLAFHFKQGESILKAIDYLMKAGEKSLKRYALEESHQYYQEAFNLLTEDAEKSPETNNLLVNLLIEWSLVYYYRGDFKGLTDRLRKHEQLALSIADNSNIGMYFAWYGFTLLARERNRESLNYLKKALRIGEENKNFKTIGYVCTWLAWVYPEFGLMEKAIQFGERAQEIYRNHVPDQYIYFKSLMGIAVSQWYYGNYKKVLEIGNALLDFGHKYSNIRSLTGGNGMIGIAYFMDGNFLLAIEYLQNAVNLSEDPVYSQAFKAALGLSYMLNSQFHEAETTLQENADFCKKFGYEIYGSFAELGLSINLIVKGQISEGFSQLMACQRVRVNNERKYYCTMAEHILGKLYSQIALGEGDIKPFDMVKNIGFLIKNVPLARKKAESHFYKAIELAKEIGAMGLWGQAYLDLGILYKEKKHPIKAKECISEAIKIFEKCDSELFLKQAREVLDSLG